MRGRRFVQAAVLALVGALCLCIAPPVGAQTFNEYLIDNYAGPPEGVTLAQGAQVDSPWGMVVATDGTLYVADYDNHRVLKVTPDGVVSRVAGRQPSGTTPSGSFSGDGGPATSAGLYRPTTLALDHAENILYIADGINDRVRAVDLRTGIITTVAGDGQSSTLNFPTGLAVATDGTLYIADGFNDRILKRAPDGTLTTFAGTGTRSFGGDDGPATDAHFNYPRGLALHPAETTLYVVDSANHRIRAIDLTADPPTITTVWGDGTTSTLNRPWPIAIDNHGSLYISEWRGHRAQKRTAAGTVTLIAGTDTTCAPSHAPCGDGGAATAAQLNGPRGIAVAPTGTVYVADTDSHRVRAIGTDGVIRPVLGTGTVGHATRTRSFDGPGLLNRIGFQADNRYGLAMAPDGTLYVSDANHRHVRSIRPDGTVRRVAGTGVQGDSGDGGPATAAQLFDPPDIALSRDGRTLYIVAHARVRAVDLRTGIITRFAGTGTAGNGGDGGLAINAQLFFLSAAVAVGPDGTVYVASDDRVRAIGTDGIIRTVAGGGTRSYNSLDGANPLDARLEDSDADISSLAITSDNTLYIGGDVQNSRSDGYLLQVSPDRTRITTLGTFGVYGLAVSRDGRTLYAADPGGPPLRQKANSDVVRAVDLTQNPPTIRIIAGTEGRSGNTGDGDLALRARLDRPSAIAVGPDGRIYVMDARSARIRVLRRTTLRTGTGGGGGGTRTVTRTVEVRPTGPTRVRARADGPTRIDLRWSGPRRLYGEAVTSYEIEVSETQDIWTTLTPYLETPSYTHTGLRPATTYAYRVYAHNDEGRSLASAVVRATTDDLRELTGYLGNPAPHAFQGGLGAVRQSGLGAVRGWECDADDVIIQINGTPYPAVYGTERPDTLESCGDTDNGFELLLNWNELGDGEHEVVAIVDGTELGRATVLVTTLGAPFVSGLHGTCEMADFPTPGENVTLVWQEARQNFVITDGRTPPTFSSTGSSERTGYLGNPAPNTFQSGIGPLSGWVCEAEEVVLKINGRSYPVPYGLERPDTLESCGDTDNGFGTVFNWNALGSGEYAVEALVDGEVLDRATVWVQTLGEEFLEDVTGTCAVTDFPQAGETVTLTWQEAQQNFVITNVE